MMGGMIKLMQLPVPDPRHTYTEGNVPLAAGYLAASLAGAGIPAAIMPREVADRGGDAAVLAWILDDPPEALGVTCFMWNLERSLWIVRKVREAQPDCRIVLGGVEMVSHHPLVEHAPVDTAVIGEGEEILPAWASTPPAHGAAPRWLCAPPPPDLARVRDPYLSGILSPRRGEIFFVETMRGCPYSCQYCLYSKRQPGLRFFPGSRVEALFRLARESRVSEIYLMDPSFNVTPDLERRLADLEAWNPDGIPLHSEARLEAVTPEVAKAMGRAGFRSVEVGLQSTNPVALETVSRSWDREKFLRGARLLREQEIRVQTGVILGLPGDGVADFLRTLDFVMESGLAEGMEIYPLSLLPGTRLRERAGDLGISFQDLPPYQVTATAEMSFDELRLAVTAAEDRLDIEFDPPVVPAFANPAAGFVEYLDLRSRGFPGSGSDLPNPAKIANRLTLRFTPNIAESELRSASGWIKEFTPYTLIQLVVDSDDFPEKAWCRRLPGWFSGEEQYFDRLHVYAPRGGRRYAVSLFHLTGDPGVMERHLAAPGVSEPVFRYAPGSLRKVRALLEEHPLLLIENSINDTERKELNNLYRGFEFLMVDVADR